MTKPAILATDPNRQRAESMRLLWKDASYRQSMLAARLAFWKSDAGQVAREQKAERLKLQSADPTFVARRKAKLIAANRGREHPNTEKRTIKPTIRDLAWAAGFIEGEGHFRRRSQVTAVQVDREPLERLLSMFGGSIRIHTPASNPRGWRESWTWGAAGARGRGIAMTLYPFLTKRRQRQVSRMLHHAS